MVQHWSLKRIKITRIIFFFHFFFFKKFREKITRVNELIFKNNEKKCNERTFIRLLYKSAMQPPLPCTVTAVSAEQYSDQYFLTSAAALKYKFHGENANNPFSPYTPIGRNLTY